MPRVMRILVVENDASTQRELVRMVRRLGHSPSTAEDVDGAVRALVRTPPDLVLVELNLPGTSGIGLLRHLAESPSDPAVVGMSAGGDLDDLICFMRLGAIDFLKKPIGLSDLEGCIARAGRRRVAPADVSWPGPPPAHRPGDPGLPERAPGVARSRVVSDPAIPAAGPPTTAADEQGELPPTGWPSQSLVDRIRVTLDSLKSGRLALPLVGNVATSVFKLTQDEECGVDEVVELVSTDPTFAVQVLRSARSGHYSAACVVDNLRDACIAIGNRAVLGIAQAVVVERLHQVEDPVVGAVAKAMWRASRVQSGAVRALATADARLDPATAQSATLLHNLGEILVLRALAAVAEAGGPAVRDPAQIARVCDSIHERVGRQFLASWGAPKAVCNLAGSHHAPPLRLETSTARSLRVLVFDVWRVSVARGFGWTVPEPDAAEALLAELPRGRRVELAQAVREADDEVRAQA